MSQIIHCCILFYIVFVVAEIGNVLLYGDPQQAEPITIWDETPHKVAVTGGLKITYMQ